ncbi:MAG TPA: hypothetical protein VK845_12065 [Gemmatimonadales bacterium]|nr:hypothetical protein [Gemmatimonadales bacterium]
MPRNKILGKRHAKPPAQADFHSTRLARWAQRGFPLEHSVM